MSRALLLQCLAAILPVTASAQTHYRLRNPLPPMPPASALPAPETIGRSRVTVVPDNAAFVAATLTLLRGARRSIDLEMFLFMNREMLEALDAKARAGVRVRVLLEPLVNGDWRPWVRRLRSDGASIAYDRSAHDQRYQIDHSKLLVVDGSRALLGGSNWQGTAALLKQRDFDLLLDGEVVDLLGELFDRSWAAARGGATGPLPRTSPGTKGIEVLGADESGHEVRDRLLYEIDHASASIRLEQFLLTDGRLIRALVRARGRGVGVRILLDHSFFRLALGGPNDATAFVLQQAGIEVRDFRDREGPERHLHAKLAIFDGRTVMLGSANWTRNGLEANRELVLLIQDDAVAQELLERLDDDWGHRGAPAQVSTGRFRALLFLMRQLSRWGFFAWG